MNTLTRSAYYLSLLAAASVAIVTFLYLAFQSHREGATIMLPPCADEDAGGVSDCYWDAQLRGNGQGTSFAVIRGVTYYPER